MSKVKQFLMAVCRSEPTSVDSVEEIARKMEPVQETSLRLPRSFAHTVRLLLAEESKTCANKASEVTARKLAEPQR